MSWCPTLGVEEAELRYAGNRLRARRRVELAVTQYLEEADALCDRLAIVDDWLIVREGTPQHLRADLRERQGLDREPTLDEVFLDATGRTRDRAAGEVQEVTT